MMTTSLSRKVEALPGPQGRGTLIRLTLPMGEQPSEE